MRKRLTKARSASLLTAGPAPRLMRSATAPQIRKLSAVTGRRKKMCEKEENLLKAYEAARALLGPRSIELPPQAQAPEDDVMRREEERLVAKKGFLERKIDKVRRLTVAMTARKQLRIKEQDRVLFNVRCGLELMTELAKGATPRGPKRHDQDSYPKHIPAFIKMINDAKLSIL